MTHDNRYVEKDYKVVGSRVKRPDGIDKVTGKARYGADASAPGGLVGRVLRSPHPHAQIVKINTAKAGETDRCEGRHNQRRLAGSHEWRPGYGAHS